MSVVTREEFDEIANLARSAGIQCQLMSLVLNRTIAAVLAASPTRHLMEDVIFQAAERAVNSLEANPLVPDMAKQFREHLVQLRQGLHQ